MNEQSESPQSQGSAQRAKDAAAAAAKKQAAKQGKNLIMRIGLLKLGAVLAVILTILLLMMALFGATYLAAMSCTSNAESLLGPGGGVTVGASVFGGPNDPTTGHQGYKEDDLRDKWDSYAELSNNQADDWSALGTALGTGKELPYMTALRVTSGKGSLVLYKRDRGAGGGDVDGHPRAIDLWHKAYEKLKPNWSGLGLVKIEVVSKGAAKTMVASDFTGGSQTSTKMVRPTSGPVTSPFGRRWGRLHAGMDIAPPAGTPIVAALDGSVVFAGVMSGYGNYICLKHTQRLSTCYGHQERFAPGISTGVHVTKGQRIGYVGSTGHSTGPHLHFEVRLGPGFSGQPTDPAPYLQGSAFAENMQETGPSQCASPSAVNVAVNGNYAWPIGNSTVGRNVIGRPGEGTHSFSAPPNNWQSDNALDISTHHGDPVVAVDDGTISPTLGFGTLTGDGGSRFAGIRLYLVDSGNNQWYYAHLSRAAVKPGQRVRRGDVIGYSGSANGVEHLHIGVKSGSPLRLLGVK